MMVVIESLTTHISDFEQVLQAVEGIEAIVQPQDAWNYQTLLELLEQDSINLLIVYAPAQNKKSNVIGYCLYQVIFEQAEILRIGTHPDYQRQGIASQIFARLNTELKTRQVESLLLEVRADNAPAIALYEQQEFALIHKRKGYYQTPHQPAVDALIMQRIYN
ncbi:ribosomal protein S18-alanine N-acetyltransferase [Psychrobacter aquimaris]|uniref:ribosomal protein S18-alanine N-acetyltransferase n=2 Tax=Psychrobacter aquimaris TaxID=292733 RepID=UPI001D119B72|nr:ribosomal protein S18-alanine N-acetyltransferase [Psychrobacter aquimaris]